MAGSLIRVDTLPAAPLDAAAQFHAQWVPPIRKALSEEAMVTIQFPPADYPHKSWRLAAIQELAREAAPVRVNGLEADDDAAVSAALDYLDNAPGITGQLLSLDPTGAGNPAN